MLLTSTSELLLRNLHKCHQGFINGLKASNLFIYHSHRKYHRTAIVQASKGSQKRTELLIREERQKLAESELYFATEKRAKSKQTFHAAIGKYAAKESLYKRGHVEFIYASMKHMKTYGVEQDLDTYKVLLHVFPKGKMIPQGVWEVEFQHYPKQQQCAIDILDKMESNGVVPDNEVGYILKEVFGTQVHCFKKFQRMLYWLPKLKNLNPYPLPMEPSLPKDPIELAILALKRMAVDLENKITVWKTSDVEEEPLEDTFIAMAHSPKQTSLLNQHPVGQPLYVEGGYSTWVRSFRKTYFVLRAEPPRAPPPNEEEEELFNWTTFFQEENPMMPKSIVVAPSIHEQPDGTILAMCITGTASKDSLVTWIRYLQQTIPRLEDIPVVFTLITPEPEPEHLTDGTKKLEKGAAV